MKYSSRQKSVINELGLKVFGNAIDCLCDIFDRYCDDTVSPVVQWWSSFFEILIVVTRKIVFIGIHWSKGCGNETKFLLGTEFIRISTF